MWRVTLLAAILVLSPSPAAFAATSDGFGALALAALVGERSPLLSVAEKRLLTRYLDGQAAAPHQRGLRIRVTSAAATCRASNVDITAYSCDLTFGSADVAIQGRAAQDLFATLAQLGVPSDGAAGSIYEGVTNLSCAIDADEVSESGGGGAHCNFGPA